MVELRERLVALGTNPTGWTLSEARGVSADGSAIAGNGSLTGQSRAWFIRDLPPECPADFNHQAGLTVQDIFDFLGAWFATSPAADFNHVNGLNVQDIFDFLNAWFTGC